MRLNDWGGQPTSIGPPLLGLVGKNDDSCFLPAFYLFLTPFLVVLVYN
jgi:hypothetical protein